MKIFFKTGAACVLALALMSTSAFAAVTGGELVLTGADISHIGAVIPVFRQMGCRVYSFGNDSIYINAPQRLRAPHTVRTMPYPGFPTDLQQPFSALLAVAQGTSVITETIFEQRYRHLDELRKMGSDNDYNDRIATITGVEKLCGTNVEALDLRGGAALIVAGLMAEGTTTVTGVHYIDRGYEKIVEKLQNLGADIKRIQ